MGCQSGAEDCQEECITPKSFHTNRVGVAEMLQGTHPFDWQRVAKVIDLPRPSVNCMSNKKAWSRGMIEHGHADKIPPCFLELSDAREVREDPSKRQDWHARGIYLKLATGVEGKGCQRCDNLDDLIATWSSIESPQKYLAQREIAPPPFGLSAAMPKGYKSVIRVYVLNGEGPKWYMHEAMYTKYAPKDTPVIMPGHTSFYGRMMEDFPSGYLTFFHQMCDNIFGLGESFQQVGQATKSKASDTIEAHYHIHGLDVVVDENFRPYTIEVNVYPSLKIDDMGRFPDTAQHRRDRFECRSMLKDFFDFVVFPQVEHGQQGADTKGWIECWPKCPNQDACQQFLSRRGRVKDVENFEEAHKPIEGADAWDVVAAQHRMETQHDLH